MQSIKIDLFGALLAIGLFLYAGKQLNLLPFIYGDQPCAVAQVRP